MVQGTVPYTAAKYRYYNKYSKCFHLSVSFNGNGIANIYILFQLTKKQNTR